MLSLSLTKSLKTIVIIFFRCLYLRVLKNSIYGSVKIWRHLGRKT